VRVDERLQRREPRLLHLAGHLVVELRCRGAGSRAVGEAERAVEAEVFDQVIVFAKSGLGFAGEADDEVRGQRKAGALGASLRTSDLYSSVV